MIESALGNQVVVAAFAVLLAAAAVSDVRSYKIPNKIVLAILLLYPVHVVVTPLPVDWLMALAVFVASLAIGFVLFATKIFGAGDAKLIAATMLWAGPTLAPLSLLICALSGGAIALLMLSPARFVIAGALSSMGRESASNAVLAKHMPYGVPIALGGLFVAWALLTADGTLAPLVDRPAIN